MSRDYWKTVYETARNTLDELRERRDALDAEREEVNLEIVQLEQVVTNLSPLINENPLDKLPSVLIRNVNDLSLADACREVLKQANKHMTPIEIRNTLEIVGYNLKQHSNPLASIHGVLKRMADSGEVEQLTHDVLGTMYRLKQGTKVLGSSPSSGITVPSPTVKRGSGGDPKPVGMPWESMKRSDYLRRLAEEADEKKDLKK